MTMPIIRLEVEGMKYQILHAFTQHNDEIEKVVADALAQVLKNFDFSDLIRKEVSRLLGECVRKGISEAVAQSLAEVPSIRSGLQLEVTRQLRGMFEGLK